jgi:hypothetical protein
MNCRKIRINVYAQTFCGTFVPFICCSHTEVFIDSTNSDNIPESLQYLWNYTLSLYKQELEGRTVDEVDASIQVETLRFEQDSAVQVDTLPPLTKLTSRDAYLYELDTAIQECITNLNSLEDALRSPTPPQGSRGQGSSPQMVRICILLCWSGGCRYYSNYM